jgi:fructoselysine-6-P-deglycase FrlB-like protein
MSYIDAELASQPECWRRAAAVAAEEASVLPAAGARVVITGCGSSHYMALAAAALREERALGLTDAFAASEMPRDRAYDQCVVISRSGTTTEVLDLLQALPHGTASLLITTGADRPAARLASRVIALPFADERSVVQTRFATTVLALVRTHLGEDVSGAASQAEGALGRALQVEPAAYDHFVFLGRGWRVGLAHEAALVLRETAGAWCESYPAMEYRHGPISAAGARTLVWMIGAGDPRLANDVRATGATVIEGDRDPMVELVDIQRTALELARSRGLDPDRPRHLTRSVVLT